MGDINHTGYATPEIAEGATVGGEVNFSPKQKIGSPSNVEKGIALGFSLLQFFFCLIGALVLFWIFKSKLDKVVGKAVSSFGPELLRGLVVAIVMPILAVILLITIIGIPLGIGLGLLYILMLIISKMIAGIVFGTWLAKIFKRPVKQINWKVVVGGVIALQLIMLIPIHRMDNWRHLLLNSIW